MPIPQREKNRIANSTVAPLHTPTIAGGIFAIDKEFFYEIGSYDEGMPNFGLYAAYNCILIRIPMSRYDNMGI